MHSTEKAYILLLHQYGIWIQDIISVMYDLRPCIRFSVKKESLENIENILAHLGLKSSSYTYADMNTLVCIIAKQENILKQVQKFEEQGKQYELGMSLGYPKCCIKFWEKNRKNRNILPFISKRVSKNYDYRLNYLFNFDTRVSIETSQILSELVEKRYKKHMTYIIPHIPCSFDCKSSKNYAEALEKKLRDTFPKYLKQLQQSLKGVFLVMGNHQFISFCGKGENQVGEFKSIDEQNSYCDTKTIQRIGLGNKILIQKEQIHIFRDSQLIDTLDKKAVLIDFTKQTSQKAWYEKYTQYFFKKIRKLKNYFFVLK